MSDTKGVERRELVSKVTTDRKLSGLGSDSAHLEGDTTDNADINSVIVKVRSPFSMKYLEILKSDGRQISGGNISRETEREDNKLKALQ